MNQDWHVMYTQYLYRIIIGIANGYSLAEWLDAMDYRSTL